MAAAGAAKEDRELVADQLAAAAGKDGRPVGEACPVLRAPVGRGPSDAAGVRGDFAEDLGAAFTGGVRAGGYWPDEAIAKEKEGGMVECPRIAPKRAQVRRLAPDWKAYRPLLMGTGTIPATRSQIRGRNRGGLLYTSESGKPKWKSRVRRLLNA